MPKFMWTVRDFTLQLVNENDEEIEPKAYLEKALEDYAVSSRSGENRNEIKQHLRKFFPDRDCCTMVRPVTNENHL